MAILKVHFPERIVNSEGLGTAFHWQALRLLVKIKLSVALTAPEAIGQHEDIFERLDTSEYSRVGQAIKKNACRLSATRSAMFELLQLEH
jgi:hypothetical protein